jgi:alpha-ketoglutaric semialdehyde dehydrogenase
MSVTSPPTTRLIANVIAGSERPAASGETFEKISPATGEVLSQVARSDRRDVDAAVAAAGEAQRAWARATPVERGTALRRIAQLLERDRAEIAAIVAAETGKSPKDAAGETDGAIEMGYFVAGEGRRLYGKTTTSAVPNRQAMVVRQPLGVAGLIIAANTPIANVAWKVFPALVCGNAAVLKASEDTPATALAFARLAAEAGLPPGVLNVVHGYGEEAGQPLVEHSDVAVVSFTGSTAVGRTIARVAGERLAKVCLELGGKNPFVVCDDADLERAADAAALSAFSNAGQRCAAGSRLIVFDAVYDDFRAALLDRVRHVKVGSGPRDECGPVISRANLDRLVRTVDAAKSRGARVLTGGCPVESLQPGYYMEPTVLENVPPNDELSQAELFGPVTCLYRVKDFDDALSLANGTTFGLTGAIHTSNVHRIQEFIARYRAGLVSINGPTYGAGPHMPFGGVKNSGNGFREPGTEALDVYTEWKTVVINHDPRRV